MDIRDTVTSLEQLRTMYREPSSLVQAKKQTVIDSASAGFIDRCPFLILSTSSSGGDVDASPRGGPPGFVQRLSDRQIAIPDLNGNNLVDSISNIVEQGHAGVLLIMPGADETLRINGRAVVTTSDDVLDGFTDKLRRPKSAIVVEVDELFAHCAKAFQRGRVWDTNAWEDLADSPDIADIISAQMPDFAAPDLRVGLAAGYAADLAKD